jgi:hypothetical protein
MSGHLTNNNAVNKLEHDSHLDFRIYGRIWQDISRIKYQGTCQKNCQKTSQGMSENKAKAYVKIRIICINIYIYTYMSENMKICRHMYQDTCQHVFIWKGWVSHEVHLIFIL